MSDVTYQVDVGNLPSGVCPSTYQEMADAFGAIYSISIPTGSSARLVVDSVKPTDQTVVWKQLVSLNGNFYPTRDYVWVGGLWVSRHALEPKSIMPWMGSVDSSFLEGFDGGSSGSVSLVSGPMWELATELAAKIPIGAGTLPSGTVLTLGSTGGEETHILTTPELPSSAKPVVKADLAIADGNAANPGGGLFGVGTGANLTVVWGGLDTAHNTMPPYYALNFLRRTARQYYVVP